MMQKLLSLTFSLLILSASANNAIAADCKVKDADIATQYSGDCLSGVANGRGTAIGQDKYVGEFRDGNKHGKGVYTWPSGQRYEGEYRDDRRNGFGKMTVPKKAYVASDRSDLGKWVGDQFVEQGIFENSKFVRSCASATDCKNKEREEYAQRERSNNEACSRLYPGKPVTMKYGQGQFLGPFYANAVIVGVGRGVASARVIGGSAYESDGYGIGSVHERSCIDF